MDVYLIFNYKLLQMSLYYVQINNIDLLNFSEKYHNLNNYGSELNNFNSIPMTVKH